LFAQTITTSGKVVDDGGKPLSSVTIRYGKQVASSGANGSFSLTAPAGTSISFKILGYESVTMTIRADKNVIVKLKESNNQMDEVVVRGYVNRARETTTGASTKISGKDIQDVPAANLESLLQGKVPGSRIIKDFQIIPWRVRDYEPSTDVNPYTGKVAPDPTDIKNPKKQDFIRPSFMSNIVGETSNEVLKTDDQHKDLVVYIRRFTGGNGHNLRFVFWDKDNKPMNPDNFNETNWSHLVHGFNRVRTSTYVQYDVAYPVPLTSYPTLYTNGDNAKVEFGYSRMGFGGVLSTARFGLNFKLFTPGDWEIIFHFKRENPKFDNE